MIDQLLEQATKEAIEWNHDYIGTEHLLLALLRYKEVDEALQNQGLNSERVGYELRKILYKGPESITQTNGLTPRSKRTLESSLKRAKAYVREKPNAIDVLNGLYDQEESVAAQILMLLGYSFIPEENTQTAFLLQNQFKIRSGCAYKTYPENYVVDLCGEKPHIMYHTSYPDLIRNALEARDLFDRHKILYTESPSLDELSRKLSDDVTERTSLLALISGIHTSF